MSSSGLLNDLTVFGEDDVRAWLQFVADHTACDQLSQDVIIISTLRSLGFGYVFIVV